LLTVAIVEELEPVWVCCGWRTPPTTHSNRFQLFHDSNSQQYGVTVTRCCSYSCFVLLKMGDNDTCSSIVLQICSGSTDVSHVERSNGLFIWKFPVSQPAVNYTGC
jgi:hypothetical protein